jgi:hypothetical protein
MKLTGTQTDEKANNLTINTKDRANSMIFIVGGLLLIFLL